MYLVTRSDLSPGQQAVQAAHAAVKLASTYAVPPEETIILLAAPSEAALLELLHRCSALRIPFADFFEPDLGWQLTAVALIGRLPSHARTFPLALQGDSHVPSEVTPPAGRRNH